MNYRHDNRPEDIRCAAIHYNDGKRRNTRQGFLTSKDRFVTRKEAAQIALDVGQITEPVDILFSEDLY